jgi:hypothetical protein
MIWKRVIVAWMTLLALVFASAGASARTDVDAKPHVGAIDVVAAICIEAHGFASAGGHQENRASATTGTSDVPDAARVGPKATTPYKRPSGATTPAQRASVQGKPCVDCGKTTSKQIADHKTPLVKEYYETGRINKTRMRSLDSVQPQCPTCSARQGAEMSRYSKEQKKLLENR